MRKLILTQQGHGKVDDYFDGKGLGLKHGTAQHRTATVVVRGLLLLRSTGSGACGVAAASHWA